MHAHSGTFPLNPMPVVSVRHRLELNSTGNILALLPSTVHVFFPHHVRDPRGFHAARPVSLGRCNLLEDENRSGIPTRTAIPTQLSRLKPNSQAPGSTAETRNKVVALMRLHVRNIILTSAKMIKSSHRRPLCTSSLSVAKFSTRSVCEAIVCPGLGFEAGSPGSRERLIEALWAGCQ